MATAISTANCTQTSNTLASTSLALTYPVANTAGDLLVAFVGVKRLSTVSAPTITLTDGAGNSWTRVSSQANTSGSVSWVSGAMFYAANCAGATNTVTAHIDVSSGKMSMFIGEVTGASTAAPLEIGASTGKTGTLNPWPFPSVTVPSAGDMLIFGGAEVSVSTLASVFSSGTGSLGPVVRRAEWSITNSTLSCRITGATVDAASSGLWQPLFTNGVAATTNYVAVTGAFLVSGGAPAANPTRVFSLLGAGH